MPDRTVALETILQQAPDFILRTDPDGRIQYVNRIQPGQDPSRMATSTIWDHIPAEYHPAIRACFERARATGQPDGVEAIAAGSPNELRHYHVRVSAVREGGVHTGFILIATDASLQTAVQRALDAPALLAPAVAASGIGFWSWDALRDVVTWDDATCRAFGVSRDQAATCFAEVLAKVHHADLRSLNQRIAAEVPTGRFESIEFRALTPTGEIRWLMTSGEATRDRDGRLVAMRGGVVDVTERKRLEEHIGQARRLEALGQLAAGVAHNFNNMLAAIIPTVELAARQAPNAADLLRIVRESAERAAGVVRQLMSFAGRRPAPTRPEHVSDLAERTVALARAMIDRKIEITLDAAPGLAVAIEPGELEHALMNLVLNARDALASAGEPRIAITIDRADAATVRVRVADNGTGMDEDTRRRAIEPFFTTKPVGAGTGLGLSSVYAVVRAAGGRLDIESAPGQGTSIAMHLPAAAVVAEDAPAVPGHLRGRGERLLLVDDDALVRSALARVLGDAGYQVTTLGDPHAAIATCANSGFDVVLLDESMPGLTGTQLLAQLVARDHRVRAISLSGLDHPIAGARAHLLKPVAAGELLRVVRTVLDQ